MSEGWSEETRARLESLARNTAMRGAGAIESNDWVGDKLLDDAADIRAALAEIERLTRERDEARSRVSSLETQWAESDTAKAIFQAMERAEQAVADVERLRAASAVAAKLLEELSASPILEGRIQRRPLVLALAALRGEGEK